MNTIPCSFTPLNPVLVCESRTSERMQYIQHSRVWSVRRRGKLVDRRLWVLALREHPLWSGKELQYFKSFKSIGKHSPCMPWYRWGRSWRAGPCLLSSQLSGFASSQVASRSLRMCALKRWLTCRSLQSRWITKQKRKFPIRQHVRTKLQWFWVYCLDSGSLVHSDSSTKLVKLPQSFFLQSQAILITVTF